MKRLNNINPKSQGTILEDKACDFWDPITVSISPLNKRQIPFNKPHEAQNRTQTKKKQIKMELDMCMLRKDELMTWRAKESRNHSLYNKKMN